jgi:hypothetical protein
MSHLGMFFQDLELATLFLNNHSDLKGFKNFENVRLVCFENNIFNEI